ncbi:MAG: hypothetical protein JNN04_11215 [Cyclobacteriaceae bacterium]|nr:hypothetical protein [Cyclobacteriaceae bacterium]
MKKLLTYSMWCLLLLAFVTSCKKDDATPTSNALIGNWKFASYATTGCTDPTNNFVETCPASADCGTLAITATGWTYTEPGVATQTGTYTVSGSSITLSGGMSETFTWAVAGTVLTFTEAPGTDGCTHVSTFQKI